jgi:UDP-N-acetylmuramate dehydrogenase
MINVQKNIPLAPFTTFRIGGPAKFFAEVKSEEELIEALKYANENNLEFFILGGGSNLLVSDKGFDGLIIKIQDTRYKTQENIIEAESGAPLALIVNLAMQNNLSGLEWAAGIPGTIGGAVRGNAGAFGGTLADAIESVKVLNISNLQLTTYNNDDCKFDYRHSIFKENPGLIVLSVDLKLNPGNKDEIQNKVKETIEKRKLKHPTENSAGSFFKNPEVKNQKIIEEFECDYGTKCQNGKMPAGWLVEQVGLKGKKIGGAMVSDKHANFIVNTGGATAEDVIMLACLIKQQVRDKFGIELQEEVQYLGF